MTTELPILTVDEIKMAVNGLIIDTEIVAGIKELKSLSSFDSDKGCYSDFGAGKIIFPPNDYHQKVKLIKRKNESTCLVIALKEEKKETETTYRCKEYWLILIWKDSFGNVFSKIINTDKIRYVFTGGDTWLCYIPWIYWLSDNEVEIRIDSEQQTCTTLYGGMDDGDESSSSRSRRFFLSSM